MSLLVRAAVLGGLAYVVSRAVRSSQHSLNSSRPETKRLERTAEYDEGKLTPPGNPRSAIDISVGV